MIVGRSQGMYELCEAAKHVDTLSIACVKFYCLFAESYDALSKRQLAWPTALGSSSLWLWYFNLGNCFCAPQWDFPTLTTGESFY